MEEAERGKRLSINCRASEKVREESRREETLDRMGFVNGKEKEKEAQYLGVVSEAHENNGERERGRQSGNGCW